MPEHRDLERALHDLRDAVAFPETPDLAGAVVARIATPASFELAPWRRARRWQRVALAAAAFVVVVSTVLALSPRARSAAAGLFDVAGIDVRFGTSDESAPPLGENLRLGRQVELAQARAAVDFPVLVPRALGRPPAVYLRGEVVSLVYDGVLVTEFAADLGQDFVVKEVPTGAVTANPQVSPGVTGFWFTGEPHRLLYNDDVTGALQIETLRLATNTLVWAEDGVTYRIEADVPLAEALRLARSLR
jgi:hypothetical protein